MKKSKLKLAILCLLPAFVLLLTGEVLVRIAGKGKPVLVTMPLPEEAQGLFQADADLFWSPRPHLDVEYEGARVTTNHLGLRAAEVPTKKDNEYRILSLGESSTFGVGVANEETYSALLEKLLRTMHPSRPITVINAGVSAYSSFQSLKYLELRGCKLEPDLVLFYHELNDYLPSSLRDSSQTEVGVVMTDRMLYESRIQKIHRSLMAVSALY